MAGKTKRKRKQAKAKKDDPLMSPAFVTFVAEALRQHVLAKPNLTSNEKGAATLKPEGRS
jgi:hypothetical protein